MVVSAAELHAMWVAWLSRVYAAKISKIFEKDLIVHGQGHALKSCHAMYGMDQPSQPFLSLFNNRSSNKYNAEIYFCN